MKVLKLSRGVFLPKKFTGIVEYPSGEKGWLLNGKAHREDGPAVITPEGIQIWCQNDLAHRVDGPAIEYANGDKEYCVLNKGMTEEHFNIFRFMWENTFLKRTKKLMRIFVRLATNSVLS